MSIQRYDDRGKYDTEGMLPYEDGDWVTFEDHAAEVARLRELLDAARGALCRLKHRRDVPEEVRALAEAAYTATLAGEEREAGR